MLESGSRELPAVRNQPRSLMHSSTVQEKRSQALRVMLIGNAESAHIQRWAESLSQRNIAVSVLSNRPRPIVGVKSLSAVVPGWRPWRPSRWQGRYRQLFRRAIQQERPDIVHLHLLGSDSIVLSELDAAKLFVSTWGSDIWELRQSTPLERAGKVASLRAATRVLASSNRLAEATCEYAGLQRHQVTTLYWGVDLEVFRPIAKSSDVPVVGFIKHLLPVYGPDTLIDAFARVLANRPDFRLWMVGNGPMEGELKQRALRPGISKSIQ